MSSTPVNTIRDHVSSTPGVCGGKPCVTGTRVRVQDVYVWHELQGQSVDEIVSAYPQLTHADVYAALAYFWDNRTAMLDEIKRGDELVEGLKQKFPTKLAKKAGGGGDAGPVPP